MVRSVLSRKLSNAKRPAAALIGGLIQRAALRRRLGLWIRRRTHKQNFNADGGFQGRYRFGLHEFANPRPEQIPDLRRSRIYRQP
jgi:hypothetical protein